MLLQIRCRGLRGTPLKLKRLFLFHLQTMEFVPIRPRNYAPTRYFVTKWEHEQVKTAKKKRERRSEHDYKYTPQDFSSETLFLTCTRDRLYDILQKEAYDKPRYEE